MLAGAGRTATWTSFNMPATIALGGTELRWLYGPERQRMRETLTNTAHTLQVDGFAGARFERRQQVSNGVITATSFLVFGGEMVALATEASTAVGTVTTLWQLKDHLGSTTTLLNISGQLSEARKGYDVWGKRRFVTGADDTSSPSGIASASNRDFTGHEYLEEIRLVHMNGRIYDPVVGRFLSPDPFIDNPLDLQSLNRYTYVNNNPLAYTDPSGYFKIGKFFSRAFRGIERVILPIIRIAVTAVAFHFGGPFAAIAVSTAWGAVEGGVNGGLKGAIYGAAISGASAVITAGIGGLDLGFDPNSVADIASKSVLHGVAQGALAAAQGGEFGPAFLAGSFAHAVGAGMHAGGVLKGEGFGLLAARTASAAIIGGTAAVIGGGKFANGAITGAFVHLFNQESTGLAKLARLVPGLSFLAELALAPRVADSTHQGVADRLNNRSELLGMFPKADGTRVNTYMPGGGIEARELFGRMTYRLTVDQVENDQGYIRRFAAPQGSGPQLRNGEDGWRIDRPIDRQFQGRKRQWETIHFGPER